MSHNEGIHIYAWEEDKVDAVGAAILYTLKEEKYGDLYNMGPKRRAMLKGALKDILDTKHGEDHDSVDDLIEAAARQ